LTDAYEPGTATLWLIACTLIIAPTTPTRAAECAPPAFDQARTAERYVQTVQACTAAGPDETDADRSALLGYLYRNGYGVPRDADRAAEHFAAALTEDACHAQAVCGLQGLEGGDAAVRCDIDCAALAALNTKAAIADPQTSAEERAYLLLAEMQRGDDGPARLAAGDLATMLDQILSQERQARDEAFGQLCTGYIKRAVVTVSLAYQLERETRRRSRLIAHHEKKVAQSNDARSQAALQELDAAQRRATADKQVFFEKYTGAVFSAGGCEPTLLDDAYRRFERDVAEVQVTDLEQQAFGLFRDHVEAARAGQGISSGWFGNLDDLLR